MAVADDDVVVLRLHPADRRIRRPEQHALERVARPVTIQRGSPGQRHARRGIDGEDGILPDVVALDQVADVARVGDRDAHAEAVDDQPPEDAVRGVEDEPRGAAASWLPSMIRRGVALLPWVAGR